MIAAPTKSRPKAPSPSVATTASERSTVASSSITVSSAAIQTPLNARKVRTLGPCESRVHAACNLVSQAFAGAYNGIRVAIYKAIFPPKERRLRYTTRTEREHAKELAAEGMLRLNIVIGTVTVLVNLVLVVLIPFIWSMLLMLLCLAELAFTFYAGIHSEDSRLLTWSLYGCMSLALLILIDYIALAEAVDKDEYKNEDHLELRVESDSFDRNIVHASMVVRLWC